MTGSRRELAYKWLQEIQQEHFELHLRSTHAQTMQHLSKGCYYEDMLEDPFGCVDRHIEKWVVGPLRERLPQPVRALVEDIPVGTLLTSDPNACAIRSVDMDLGPVVIVDWMLLVFLGKVIKPVLRLLDHISTEEKLLMARRILDAGDYFSTVGLRGTLEADNYDPVVVRMGDSIEVGALTFIVCHEYAHVLLGHLDPRDVTLHRAGFTMYNKSFDQEFEADLRGLHLATYYLPHVDEEFYKSPRSRLACGSPLILMSILHFLERFFNSDVRAATHPPTLARRERLVDIISRTLTEHAGAVTQWFAEAVSHPWEDVQDRGDG
jgi:hypothetical protein